jgi:hypothetical protein
MSTVKHTYGFSIDRPIDIVFPLFSAEGEKLWIPGWTYENVTGSKNLQEDYVFLTPGRDEADPKVIWLTKKHRPQSYCLQFYKVEPENKVAIVSIRCSKESDDATGVVVSYEYIGLSKEGNRFIETFTFPEYKKFIDQWKRLLLNYFEARVQDRDGVRGKCD